MLVYLILAVTGSFVFSIKDSFRFDIPNPPGRVLGGYFSSTDHAVDWLAENITAVGKARSPVPLRNGFLRVFTLAGISIAAVCFIRLYFKEIKKDNSLIIKTNVPLKLRI